MRILVNENNQIVGYSVAGSLEDDFEIRDDIIPQDFTLNYKPKYYLYKNEQIVVNPDYEEESNIPYVPPMITTSSADDLLRKMFANMQEQLVEGNTVVAQVAQQNAKLSQEVVELKNEIEAIKGENKDEDAISEV